MKYLFSPLLLCGSSEERDSRRSEPTRVSRQRAQLPVRPPGSSHTAPAMYMASCNTLTFNNLRVKRTHTHIHSNVLAAAAAAAENKRQQHNSSSSFSLYLFILLPFFLETKGGRKTKFRVCVWQRECVSLL